MQVLCNLRSLAISASACVSTQQQEGGLGAYRKFWEFGGFEILRPVSQATLFAEPREGLGHAAHRVVAMAET